MATGLRRAKERAAPRADPREFVVAAAVHILSRFAVLEEVHEPQDGSELLPSGAAQMEIGNARRRLDLLLQLLFDFTFS